MKTTILSLIISYTIVFCFSCDIHTLIEYENAEIPSRALPNDIPKEIISQYRVGEVIILPSIKHDNTGLSTYFLRIDAFSNTEFNLTLKSIILLIDNEILPYGEDISGGKFPPAKYNNRYKAYHSQLDGNILTIAMPENKNRIDVTINIEVNRQDNNHINGSVSTVFLQNTIKYLE